MIERSDISPGLHDSENSSVGACLVLQVKLAGLVNFITKHPIVFFNLKGHELIIEKMLDDTMKKGEDESLDGIEEASFEEAEEDREDKSLDVLGY